MAVRVLNFEKRLILFLAHTRSFTRGAIFNKDRLRLRQQHNAFNFNDLIKNQRFYVSL